MSRAVERQRRQPVALEIEATRQIYCRVLSNWASDLLVGRRLPQWPASDPQADFRDRNWRQFYQGSVLDD